MHRNCDASFHPYTSSHKITLTKNKPLLKCSTKSITKRWWNSNSLQSSCSLFTESELRTLYFRKRHAYSHADRIGCTSFVLLLIAYLWRMDWACRQPAVQGSRTAPYKALGRTGVDQPASSLLSRGWETRLHNKTLTCHQLSTMAVDWMLMAALTHHLHSCRPSTGTATLFLGQQQACSYQYASSYSHKHSDTRGNCPPTRHASPYRCCWHTNYSLKMAGRPAALSWIWPAFVMGVGAVWRQRSDALTQHKSRWTPSFHPTRLFQGHQSCSDQIPRRHP